MFRHHENVGDPREGGVVGDDARESHLLMAVVHAERQRVFDRAFDNLTRPPATPV